MRPLLKTAPTIEARATMNGQEYAVTLERQSTWRGAHVAYCDECETFIEPNQYWSLDKSVHLHRSGQGCRRIGYYVHGELHPT